MPLTERALLMPPTVRSPAGTYKVMASKIATHRPSDNTSITSQDAAGLSREWGTRFPHGRTGGRSSAG